MKVTSKTLELSIVSSNLMHEQPLAHPAADAKWIKEHFAPDIWGCQESEAYANTVLNKIPGYAVALPAGASSVQRQNPILYNTKTMKLVSAHAVLMHKGQAHAYPDRYVNWARFVDRTDGNDIYYFNTHLNSHIEVAGHPRDLPRVKLSTEHIIKMARLVKEKSSGNAVVFWGGDFNVDEDADDRVSWQGFPNAIFKKYSLVSVYDELHTPKTFDTHDTRKIDVIGSHAADVRVKAVNVARSPNTVFSDHRFIKATYTLLRTRQTAGKDPASGSSSSGAEFVGDTTMDQSIPVEQDALPAYVEPETELPPVLEQPVGTIDHSVCCRKA